jgi:hypothetical protein
VPFDQLALRGLRIARLQSRTTRAHDSDGCSLLSRARRPFASARIHPRYRHRRRRTFLSPSSDAPRSTPSSYSRTRNPLIIVFTGPSYLRRDPPYATACDLAMVIGTYGLCSEAAGRYAVTAASATAYVGGALAFVYRRRCVRLCSFEGRELICYVFVKDRPLVTLMSETLAQDSRDALFQLTPTVSLVRAQWNPRARLHHLPLAHDAHS